MICLDKHVFTISLLEYWVSFHDSPFSSNPGIGGIDSVIAVAGVQKVGTCSRSNDS